MKKKWIALLLAGVLALTPVLSGCSSGDGESSSSGFWRGSAQGIDGGCRFPDFTLTPPSTPLPT